MSKKFNQLNFGKKQISQKQFCIENWLINFSANLKINEERSKKYMQVGLTEGVGKINPLPKKTFTKWGGVRGTLGSRIRPKIQNCSKG